ncbi:MAG TPA: hypothetical protein VLG50_00020 [Candidatus Saccharimonadales bacterium]|nr:hypothetical protein [Candidatus Saccharimonadales bacterium]
MKKQIVAFILAALTNSYIQTMDNSEQVILTPRCHERIKNHIIARLYQTQNRSLSQQAKNGEVAVTRKMVNPARTHERRDVANSIIQYHATLSWTEENNGVCFCCKGYTGHSIGPMIIPEYMVSKESDPKHRMLTYC